MFNNSKGLFNKLFTIISNYHGHFTNMHSHFTGAVQKARVELLVGSTVSP